MIKIFERFLQDNNAKYLISILIGLGIATIFRKACKGRECIIVKSPDLREYERGVYEFDSKCYTFKSKVTNCDAQLD